MRKLNLKFVALLIVLMPMVALGATETPILDNLTFVKDAYNAIMSVTQDVMKTLTKNAYRSISSIFNNVISVLLGLIAFFWLFKHLKTASISREEAFKAMIWVITFVVVYVLMNSENAYHEFNKLFLIPQHLVSALVSSGEGNAANQLNNAFIMPYKAYYYAQDFGFDEIYNAMGPILQKIGVADSVAWYGSRIGMWIYQFTVIFFAILIIAIIVVHIYSNFLSCIYLIFLPIMIPLLLMTQTRSIFFAWVKSYIGITLYLPLSMIPISIMLSINKLMTQDGGELWHNTTYYTFVSITFLIISFGLLSKIPTWLGELLGTANQGVGAGGAIGMMKTAGMAYGALGKSIAGNILNSKSAKGAIGRTIANVATGGMYAPIASAASAIKKGGFSAIGKMYRAMTRKK